MQDNELVSNRLGARNFALNLGQLPACPTHLDLNEIPVIAAGFSILSPQLDIWQRSPQRLPPALAMRSRPSVDMCNSRQEAQQAGLFAFRAVYRHERDAVVRDPTPPAARAITKHDANGIRFSRHTGHYPGFVIFEKADSWH